MLPTTHIQCNYVGRFATEDVVLHLLMCKCTPCLEKTGHGYYVS